MVPTPHKTPPPSHVYGVEMNPINKVNKGRKGAHMGPVLSYGVVNNRICLHTGFNLSRFWNIIYISNNFTDGDLSGETVFWFPPMSMLLLCKERSNSSDVHALTTQGPNSSVLQGRCQTDCEVMNRNDLRVHSVQYSYVNSKRTFLVPLNFF